MLFSFLVLTYNHEKYILQNLESIKYQIINYGQGYEFQLVITDDASKDKTTRLVNYWVDKNRELFKYINIESNDTNQGTCKNYLKGLELIKGDYIKLIAGDDVFVAGNIFELVDYLKDYDFIMGVPILFTNNKMDEIDDDITIKQLIYHISIELFFREELFYKRIRRNAFVNAPNTFFRKELAQNNKVIDFLSEFRVIDDYSQWLKMAELDIKYKFVPKFMVLYRRTEGSTFIIKRNDFYYDRIALFKYLISTEKCIINKLIQYNSFFCFKSNNIFIRKYFDINNYINKIAQVLCRKEAIKMVECLRQDFELNKKHLGVLVENANKELSIYNLKNKETI